MKVDNLPGARPQYGLHSADVVYEEPVEGGLTRFIAIYQCRDSGRVEPIRSARIVDPQIVSQFGAHPLFAFAGGIDPAVTAVDSSSLIDVGINHTSSRTYWLDPGRRAPHNLESSTAALYEAGQGQQMPPTPPQAVFSYGSVDPRATAVRSVYIAYALSSVTWRWDASAGYWTRWYGSEPAAAGEGGQLSATNVIVMTVSMYASPYVEDASGIHENLLALTGSGAAQVCRQGKCTTGTWNRPSLGDVTHYLDTGGRAISLGDGATWVELVPTTVSVTSS